MDSKYDSNNRNKFNFDNNRKSNTNNSNDKNLDSNQQIKSHFTNIFDKNSDKMMKINDKNQSLNKTDVELNVVGSSEQDVSCAPTEELADYDDIENDCNDEEDIKQSSTMASIQSALVLTPSSPNTAQSPINTSDTGIQTSRSTGQLDASNKFKTVNKSSSCTADWRYITVHQTGERENWDKKIEFLLAVIGFAVDLGNVWRFPFVCYRNGGGAFLIPYLVMLVFGGLPLFYLELALGQYYSSGCLTIWKKLCPIMKGIGYAICFIDLYMAMYYNTIIAWAFYYLFASISSLTTFELPWMKCNNPWNTEKCKPMELRKNGSKDDDVSPAQEYFERQVQQIQLSNGIDSIGPIKWSLAFCLMMVFILVYFSLWKGVKSTGKVVWVTALMPYFVLFILLIRGVTLDGSMDGIKYYLSPSWEKLYSINVWIDAATQIFFSLGPGFGTLMALSSYNKFHNNCYRDAIFTSSVNCLTSFVAGFVIFSVLGYMAKTMNKKVSDVATGGPGLVFIVYPEAIATMHGSVFWSILFFVMLITLGLDSTFGGLEAMITGLCDEYPTVLRRNREIFVAFLIIFIYLCALPTTTYGGSYVLNLLDHYGTSLSVLFIVFVETIAVCWCYGSEKFSDQIQEMLGARPGVFWRTCWKFISPLFLGFIFFAALFEYKNLSIENYTYPNWSIIVGWLITLSSLSCIPLYAIYRYITLSGSPIERLVKSFKPENTVEANCLRDEVRPIKSHISHV